MSDKHKNPTISFRITDAERKQIEARILASGMMKKDYFVRSCIYNRLCVVGKNETIYPLVQTVNALYLQLLEMQKAFTAPNSPKALAVHNIIPYTSPHFICGRVIFVKILNPPAPISAAASSSSFPSALRIGMISLET